MMSIQTSGLELLIAYIVALGSWYLLYLIVKRMKK